MYFGNSRYSKSSSDIITTMLFKLQAWTLQCAVLLVFVAAAGFRYNWYFVLISYSTWIAVRVILYMRP